MKSNRHIEYNGRSEYPPEAWNPEEIYFEKDVHLRDYLKILHKRKSIVYAVFIMIMSVTMIITFSQTPIFKATAKLLIKEMERDPLSDLRLFGNNQAFLATQTQIIKSTPVSQKVVDMLHLETTFDDYFNPQKEGISLVVLKYAVIDWCKDAIDTTLRLIGIAEAKHTDELIDIEEEAISRIEQISSTISEKINILPEKDSNIIKLSYMSPNPVLAANIVNGVAKAYIDKTLDMKMEASSYTLNWMGEKAEEEQQKLEQSERALQEYIEKNDIVTIENKVTITPQKLSEINRRLIQTQAQRKELGAVYRQVRRLPADLAGAESLQVISSDPAIRLLRNQVLEAQKKVTDLSKKYGPKHPIMQRAQADLKILDVQQQQEIKRVIRSIKNEFDMVLSKEKEYEDLLSDAKTEAVKMNEKIIQYNKLLREVETNNHLYNTLITKIKEQNVSEQAQSINVWVVEKAKVPDIPAKPNKKRNMLIGLILAVFGGVGLAFFLEYLDNTVKYPDDVEDRFGLPVLGAVPLLKSRKASPEKEVLENPASVFSENIKNIRTAVMLSSAKGLPKCLLVTSVAPEEGKTTSALNLAVSMAQAEKRVLLIDADMRKPRLHTILNYQNTNGLSNYLSGSSSGKLIRKGPHENLDVLTSGPIPPNPSELLISKRTDELIRSAEKQYDLIIFDAPPILTVSDGLIIGKHAEGLIIVVRSARTTYEMLEKGIHLLENIGEKIIGVVLNAVEMNKNDGGYYFSQYYGSYNENNKR